MKQALVNLSLVAGVIFLCQACIHAHTNWMYLFALLGGVCIGFYTDNVYKKGDKK